MKRECEYLDPPRAQADFDAMDDLSSFAVEHAQALREADCAAATSRAHRHATVWPEQSSDHSAVANGVAK